MSFILSFLRLLRPINVLILFVTMYSIRFFYTFIVNPSFNTNLNEKINYFLFVFSTTLILAGGNIINDYFDVKADKINKPDKIIINKFIKQRFAILSHWIINTLALFIGVYLSIIGKSFSFVFVFLFAINILWFYSVRFKRQLIIGNLTISILTCSIPFICLMYFNVFNFNFKLESTVEEMMYFFNKNRLIFLFALFSFIINFLREIIKDVKDVEGDKRLKANTIPIYFGINKSKKIIIFLYSIVLLILIFFLFKLFSRFELNFFYPLILIFFIIIISFLLLLRNKWDSAELFLKISMFLGIILPFYWKIVIILN